jgi:hypothetical protein
MINKREFYEKLYKAPQYEVFTKFDKCPYFRQCQLNIRPSCSHVVFVRVRLITNNNSWNMNSIRDNVCWLVSNEFQQ